MKASSFYKVCDNCKEEAIIYSPVSICKKCKQRARRKLEYAVKAGHIRKPDTCEKCYLNKPLQAHHSDYSLALLVTWLCHTCHKKAHNPLLTTPPLV